MKLQLALDDVTLEQGLALVDSVREYVNIIEIGTPFIIASGMTPVREFTAHFPELEVLADTKIMDAGDYEAELAFDAGADYCTVLGVTDTLTGEGCLAAARRAGRAVVVDMICVGDIPARVTDLESAGVRHLGVHVGVDRQAAGITPYDELVAMKRASTTSIISVAGGITPDTVGRYAAAGADIAVVGSGIVHAAEPVAAAQRIHDLLGQA